MPDYDPVHLTFNDKPRAIVDGMDEMATQGERIAEFNKSRRWIPWVLFFAGFPVLLIDLAIKAMGYDVCIFSLAAPVFWIAAIVLWISMRRSRKVELPPRFTTTREILHTLRDDVHPKRNFFGEMDLTGTRLDSKVAQESSDTQDRVTKYYRDEWLSLKTKLYDGNMLRFAAITREKVRQGYWKRGTISGKMKWKPEKFKGARQEMRVRLSVNPELYIAPEGGPLAPGMKLGLFTIKKYQASGGLIDLAAYYSGSDLSEGDVLGLLRSVYDLLGQRTAT
jgi:hypothetical protein